MRETPVPVGADNEQMMRTAMNVFTLVTLCVASARLQAAESAFVWQQGIETRRGEYLDWIVENFGNATEGVAI